GMSINCSIVSRRASGGCGRWAASTMNTVTARATAMARKNFITEQYTTRRWSLINANAWNPTFRTDTGPLRNSRERRCGGYDGLVESVVNVAKPCLKLQSDDPPASESSLPI